MFDWLAKSVFEQIVGTPQDKDRAQEQLRPVLERRLQPCLDLWKDLWQFADNLEKRQRERKEVLATGDEIRRLHQRVDSFIREYGALISVPCLSAFGRLQAGLRDLDPDEKDEMLRKARLHELYKQLFPWSEKDDKGKGVQNPGLFLLLRDEIGSNTKAASSVLK